MCVCTMQASIEYGEHVLDKIYTSFDYTSQVDVTFIENHFEKEFRPHTEEPVEVHMLLLEIWP